MAHALRKGRMDIVSAFYIAGADLNHVSVDQAELSKFKEWFHRNHSLGLSPAGFFGGGHHTR